MQHTSTYTMCLHNVFARHVFSACSKAEQSKKRWPESPYAAIKLALIHLRVMVRKPGPLISRMCKRDNSMILKRTCASRLASRLTVRLQTIWASNGIHRNTYQIHRNTISVFRCLLRPTFTHDSLSLSDCQPAQEKPCKLIYCKGIAGKGRVHPRPVVVEHDVLHPWNDASRNARLPRTCSISGTFHTLYKPIYYDIMCFRGLLVTCEHQEYLDLFTIHVPKRIRPKAGRRAWQTYGEMWCGRRT